MIVCLQVTFLIWNHDTDAGIEHMITRIQQWLAPPDLLPRLRNLLKLRSALTGKWYLQSVQYRAWKNFGGPQFTWLYGFPGSGKTILSAGIVEDLQRYCNEDPPRSLAFFFFDFNDAEKQDAVSMVRSLLSQFLDISARAPEALLSLYATCEGGHRQASEQQLLHALKDILAFLPAPYVVLDALDECSNRDKLFDMLNEMKSWGYTTMRVLVTSRKEIDIEEEFEDLVPLNSRTCLESHLVDRDIQTYVQERLAKDKSFKRWQRDLEVQAEIERTLVRKASGM